LRLETTDLSALDSEMVVADSDPVAVVGPREVAALVGFLEVDGAPNDLDAFIFILFHIKFGDFPKVLA
jgi:hypothetical protein